MDKQETLKRVEKFLDIVATSDKATMVITINGGDVTSLEYTIVEEDNL